MIVLAIVNMLLLLLGFFTGLRKSRSESPEQPK
jgi:hypothetical protein